MLQPGRQYTAGAGYRYGFNGKENDNEVKGEGNQQDYGMRIYDPRLGKFLSIDPLSRSYPMLTPFQFSTNSPVQNTDLDGKEGTRYKIQINGNTLIEVVNLKIFVNLTNNATYVNGIFAGGAYENKTTIINELQGYVNDCYNGGKDIFQAFEKPLTVNETGDPIYYNIEIIPIESANNTDFLENKHKIINSTISVDNRNEVSVAKHFFKDNKIVDNNDHGDNFTFLKFGIIRKGVAEFTSANEVVLDATRYATRGNSASNLQEFKNDVNHEIGHKLLSRHPSTDVRRMGDVALLHNLVGGIMSYNKVLTVGNFQVSLFDPTTQITPLNTTRILESVVPLPIKNIKIYSRNDKPQ